MQRLTNAGFTPCSALRLLFRHAAVGAMLLLSLPLTAGAAQAAAGFFEPLKERLIKDGFAPQYINEVYRANPTPLFETVAGTMRMRESKMNYQQFLKPAAIAQARKFLRGHQRVLDNTEKTYGVNKCVIVAILSVETRFGSYTGFTPTLDILSTFALMDRKGYRDAVWDLMSATDRQRWGREGFDEKLIKRSEWAYQELHALLTWSRGRPEKARAFKGSLMGAVGWPQFLPSSLVRHGVDGDGDGQVDLFEPTDAIVSVANYLTAYGWGDATSRAQKERVIHSYNHSQPYVDTILEIADKLQYGY